MNWLKSLGLENLKLPPLKSGSHDDPSKGLCAMEMVAFIERLPHSDRPACTCPVIGALTRYVNDSLPSDKARAQLLTPRLPLVVGTVAPKFETIRAYAILQAVFDLAAGLEFWGLPSRRREPDGRVVAFPPWDYAHKLERAYHAYGGPPTEMFQELRDALVATEPDDMTTAALNAATIMQSLERGQSPWRRDEPMRVAVMPTIVSDDAPLETLITMRYHAYRPSWTEWKLGLLEHVLAIGPKAKGWSGTEYAVTNRVEQLTELA